jgi:hypothetical protein
MTPKMIRSQLAGFVKLDMGGVRRRAQTLSLSITNKNRFSGTDVSFDNAGNLTNDGLGHAYSWHGENQLTSTASVNYTYDGDGQRVQLRLRR